jgi:hypothetical protein
MDASSMVNNKRPMPASLDPTSGSEDEASGGELAAFELVGDKKNKKIKAKRGRADLSAAAPAPAIPASQANSSGLSQAAASAAAPNVPASQAVSHPPRVAPVLLLGLNEEQKRRYLFIYTVLGVDRKLIRHVKLTANGNMVITPSSEADKASLLAAKNIPPNLSFKDLADRPTNGRASPFIVLRGVNLAIDVATISEALGGLPCFRLRGARNEGKPTMKVKVKCLDPQRRKELLSGGATVGLEHFKASAYEGDSAPTLQCFKCYGIGHLAQGCSNALVCRKCGGAHLAEECPAESLLCTNCKGAHAANDRQCPQIIAHKESTVAKKLSYAAATSKPADQLDSLKLAACIALSFLKIKSRDSPTVKDICNDAASSVANAYKSNIAGVHVHSLIKEQIPTNNTTQLHVQ